MGSRKAFLCFSVVASVADSAQYLGIPPFGGKHPGDIYYCFSLRMYCSTLVKHLVLYSRAVMGMLKFMVQKENNDASLLMKALHNLGCITSGKYGKGLSTIMDNCSSQNKKGHVL
jgi:hypothetical protein